MRKAVFNGPVIYLIASMQRESVQVLLWGSVHGRLLVSFCNSGAKGEPTYSWKMNEWENFLIYSETLHPQEMRQSLVGKLHILNSWASYNI